MLYKILCKYLAIDGEKNVLKKNSRIFTFIPNKDKNIFFLQYFLFDFFFLHLILRFHLPVYLVEFVHQISHNIKNIKNYVYRWKCLEKFIYIRKIIYNNIWYDNKNETSRWEPVRSPLEASNITNTDVATSILLLQWTHWNTISKLKV